MSQPSKLQRRGLKRLKVAQEHRLCMSFNLISIRQYLQLKSKEPLSAKNNVRIHPYSMIIYQSSQYLVKHSETMSRTANKAQIFFGFICVGCLVAWVILTLQQSGSSSYVSCSSACGYPYIYDQNDYCCNASSSSYSCISKKSCQQKYDVAKIALEIFFSMSLALTVIIGCCKRKPESNPNPPLNYVFQAAPRNVGNARPAAQNRYQPPVEQPNIQDRLPQSFIYRESKSQCAVCFEPFYEDEKSMVLECGHVFHSKCIRDWVGKQANCPLCRSKV